MTLPPASQNRSGSGFTILEVLTAMVILALVVSLVFGSFNTVFSSADRINTGSDLFEMGNACMMRIGTDLQDLHVSLYPRYKPPDIDDPPEIYRFAGSRESIGGETYSKLRFTTLAHLPTHQGAAEGIAEVVYYARETENDGIVIKRADTLFPYPDEFEARDTDPVMCEHVRAFELLFYDHDNQEYEDWDSQDDDYEYNTPRSVGIKFVIGDEEAQYEFSTEVGLPANRYQPLKR